MTKTKTLSFAAASLAALIAVPAFAAPTLSQNARVGQAWEIVDMRHQVGGDNAGTVGPVFQSEVNEVLQSANVVQSAAPAVREQRFAPNFRDNTRIIEVPAAAN